MIGGRKVIGDIRRIKDALVCLICSVWERHCSLFAKELSLI